MRKGFHRGFSEIDQRYHPDVGVSRQKADEDRHIRDFVGKGIEEFSQCAHLVCYLRQDGRLKVGQHKGDHHQKSERFEDQVVIAVNQIAVVKRQ